MSEHDETIGRVIRELQRPIPASPGLERQVMARVLTERHPRWAHRWWSLGSLAAAAGLVGVLLIARGPRGQAVAFTLVAPRASTVAVVGDFNDWNPKASPLARSPAGTWETRVRLAPGQYNYAFIVDGSTWVPDPRAPRVAVDDFGSPNSVVTVPGASL